MPPTHRLSRVVLLAMAVAPVVAVAGWFRDAAAANLGVMAAGLVGWEALLLALTFAGKVYGRLEERWVDRVAEWTDAALRRTISRYPREYRYFLSRMHHDVDLRGLSTWGMYSLAMDEVFVDLTLRSRAPHQVPTGPVADSPASAPSEHYAGRRSVWEMLDQFPDTPLAILGPPGSGKTTLLRHVTLVLCRQARRHRVPRRWRRRVPVLLFLREHVATISGDPAVTLPDVVRHTLHRLTRREPPGWLVRQLDAGRCVVMLDGLDEVARREDRAVVMKWVREQIAQYPRNRYLVTSRPYGFDDSPLSSVTVLQVRELTDTQIERFVRSWYLAVERRSSNRTDVGVQARAAEGADRLLGSLYASPDLLALATNPLLLTMITSVHKYRSALPGSRAELYREICQVFLGKRQEAKGLSSDLSIEQQALVLRTLAYTMMERRIRDIPATGASEVISAVLARIGYQGTAAEFLTGIEQTSGLLVEREPGVYAFAHHTFQEYFAARQLAETEPLEFHVRTIQDPWWREVTLLRIASADATPVVRAALASEPLTTDLLALAADCTGQAREVDADVKQRVATALLPTRTDRDRNRLAAQVMLTRKLRQVIRATNGDFICAEPVTNAEFRFFVNDLGQRVADLCPRDWDNLPATANNRPVAGIGAEAALRFVEWAQGLGVNAGLPDLDGLSAVDCQRTIKPPARGIWARRRADDGYSVGLRWADDPSSAGPEFTELLLRQMALDAAVIRTLIPPDRVADVGLRDGSGPVMVKVPVVALVDLPWSSSDHADEARRRLASIAGGRLRAGLPANGSPELVPVEYWRHVPHLVRAAHRRWLAGLHWSVRWSIDRHETTFQTPLSSDDLLEPASVLFRAYGRLCQLTILEWDTQLLRRGRRRGLLAPPFTDRVWMLAVSYLQEWRARGLLPPVEGLSLIRV